jgi:predicted dehydrogenase
MGRWHAHAIQRSGGRVVAVIDPDVARASALAARLPGRPPAEREIGHALRAHGVDVLHVCTPLASHEPIAREAIDAGVHLLVEKPLAADASTVEKLHAAAMSAGVVLCPVHQFLFQAGILQLQRELASLGTVRQLDVLACSAGADGGSDTDREQVARDILPHGLALARRLLGGALASADWQVGRGAAGELRVLGQVGDASVSLSVSMHARPTENSLVLRADGGTARANLFHGFVTIERGTASRRDKVLRPFVGAALQLGAASGNLVNRAARGEAAYPGLRELVHRFHLAAAGRGPIPITMDESIDVARARDIVASARTRDLL